MKKKNEERTSFFFFFASHFSKKPLKLVLGLPKWKFSTGKKHFTPGKKSGKMILPPQKNFPVMPCIVVTDRIGFDWRISVLNFPFYGPVCSVLYTVKYSVGFVWTIWSTVHPVLHTGKCFGKRQTLKSVHERVIQSDCIVFLVSEVAPSASAPPTRQGSVDLLLLLL